jgi:ferredoxin
MGVWIVFIRMRAFYAPARFGAPRTFASQKALAHDDKKTETTRWVFCPDEISKAYGIILSMATQSAGMVPDELKFEPKSKGLTTPRKKKPKELAVITECCTGCAGSPACVEYCPVEDCMFWVPDEDHPPFGRIQVDPILCIGCKKCLSKGPDGAFLDGCPWDAIVMVETTDVEKEVGVMPI